MRDSKSVVAMMIVGFGGWAILTWVIGISVHQSLLGVAMEASLWLPWSYQIGLPDKSGFVNLAFFVVAACIASRVVVTLITWPTEREIKESRTALKQDMHARHDDDRWTRAVLEMCLVAPLSLPARNCLLVFMVLASVGFPYLESEQTRAEQFRLVEKLRGWLDIDWEHMERHGVDNANDFIAYKLLRGEVSVRPHLNCKKSDTYSLPVPEKSCTPDKLKDAFDRARAEYFGLEAAVSALGDSPSKPRWWLPVLIVVWLVGAIYVSRAARVPERGDS